jgi:hypothetical protein
MIKISYYQLPYHYGSTDRFYKEGGVVNLPTPSLINTIADGTKGNVTFIPITLKTAELTTSGNIDYNYIKVEGLRHNELDISYWFITDTELIIPGLTYKHTLQYDILNSMELFKNINDDLKINIERKIYNSYKNSNNKLILKDERNPQV